MSELVSSEQIENLVDKIVKEKLDQYFRMSPPGFEIVSGHKVPGHGIGEFCMTTDTIQGIHFYQHGNAKMAARKSIEIYSSNIKNLDEIKNLISLPGDTDVTLLINDNKMSHHSKLNKKRKIDREIISQLKKAGVTLKIQ